MNQTQKDNLQSLNELNVARVGYSKKHAERLRRDFLRDGESAFKDKRFNNRDRILTKAERVTVIQILQTKQPKDVIVGSSAEHWTTTLLGMHILEATGIQDQRVPTIS